MCGSANFIVSPSNSKIKRKTPCAAGCCGPKLIKKFLILLSEKFSKTDLQILIPTKWNSINNNHLKLLKNADLISEYKEKNFVYYEINTTVFDELIIWVNQFGGKKVWKK